jgi:hypothetical protein
MSFLTSCWLLPQNVQYSVFSPEFAFFSQPWKCFAKGENESIV